MASARKVIAKIQKRTRTTFFPDVKTPRKFSKKTKAGRSRRDVLARVQKGRRSLT